MFLIHFLKTYHSNVCYNSLKIFNLNNFRVYKEQINVYKT